MELLAPAGNLECAMAALHYGADAVYLGMNKFSARADADNFTLDDVSVLLGLAHGDLEHPRKVYVAVNTLVRDAETADLLQLLSRLRELSVDALIVQDMAVYDCVHRYFPEFALHASTQMAIHNVAGMEAARDLGFTRAVAARELTLPELRAMAAVPGIELEVFVHGALCHAFSGLCLLSSCLRGSSGNRGNCCYFCRNTFRVDEGGRTLAAASALMSMKDLAAGDVLPALREAQVASVKIEGRKKTPLYVAAVTNYYRKLLDDTFEPGEREECEHHIKSIFSRPWTKFFLQNHRSAGITEPDTVGPQGAEVGVVQDVVADADGEGDLLRFVIRNQVLEKHDGLQIEVPGSEKPFGFPVDDIRVFQQGNVEVWTHAYEAAPGVTVEVPLPAKHPPIAAGQTIYCASSQVVKRSYAWPSVRPALDRARHPVYFQVRVAADKLSVLSQPCVGPRELADILTEYPLPSPLAPAQKPEQLGEAVRGCFAKLGDSVFTLAEVQLDNPEQLFVPTSLLNELRRRAVADIERALAEDRQQSVAEALAEMRSWSPPLPAASAAEVWSIKLDQPGSLNLFSEDDLAGLGEVVLDLGRTPLETLRESLSDWSVKLGRNRVRLALPAVTRPGDLHDWPELLAELYRGGWRRWEIANLSGLALLAEAGATPETVHLTADWPLYVCNRPAARALSGWGISQITLSPEDTWENWSTLLESLGGFAQVPVFQDIPLAISAVCAKVSVQGYCPGFNRCDFTEMSLRSRKGEELLAINNSCQTVYIHQRPFDLGGRLAALRQAGARHFRADFLWRDYAPVAVHQIWQRLRQDGVDGEPWTAGLF